MVSNDNLMLEGMKILASINVEDFNQPKEVIQIADTIINILCINNYYYGTGVYEKFEIDKQKQSLKNAILNYKTSC
jgi:hypothetical protein